ncbi:MAG: CoA pyrophosphatase [Spirochaetae bacterium HGW-Spirochaetae-7]|nr:MAG: CoA pyrophosphatase [Spirochaetae bacterium HGW-Spirochaetae-7]
MTLDHVLLALAGPLPGEPSRAAMQPGYRRDPSPETATSPWRKAAVLILLYADGGALRFPLMLRPAGNSVHSGQVSLPGGSREGDESFEECAIRETIEELGVEPGSIRLVRALSPLKVPPSRFYVQPFVGLAESRLEFVPEVAEVAALYEPSLDELLDPGNRRSDLADFGGRSWTIPYYRLAGQRVWGATAMVLAELEAMLRQGDSAIRP